MEWLLALTRTNDGSALHFHATEKIGEGGRVLPSAKWIADRLIERLGPEQNPLTRIALLRAISDIHAAHPLENPGLPDVIGQALQGDRSAKVRAEAAHVSVRLPVDMRQALAIARTKEQDQDVLAAIDRALRAFAQRK